MAKLRFHAIHHATRGNDRFAWARGVLNVAFLDAVGRDESDVKMAVHVGTNDRLVVACNRPGEWLLGVGQPRPQKSWWDPGPMFKPQSLCFD